METTELALTRADYEAAAGAEVARFLPVMKMEQALERREVIVQAFSRLMKDGDDYGKIPGSKSPTLKQPGAQKLDNLFGLVPRFIVEEREEDWTGESHGGEPFFRYMIKCQLFRGDFVMGEAIGECNSWESKYRYRTSERVCPDCGKSALLQTKHKKGPDEGKPKNFWCAPFKGGCGHAFKLDHPAVLKQESGRKTNDEIFDQVNTLLKMAQKRAHVGATINATSASEFFTQDLEDQREPESSDGKTAGDQGSGSGGDSPSPSGAVKAPTAGTANRAVPEELKVMFANLDADPKHTAQSFKMLEDALVQAGGANGIQEYQRIVLAWREKNPKGTIIPMSKVKECLIDLFEASLAVTKPDAANFTATDADLPEILQEEKK